MHFLGQAALAGFQYFANRGERRFTHTVQDGALTAGSLNSNGAQAINTALPHAGPVQSQLHTVNAVRKTGQDMARFVVCESFNLLGGDGKRLPNQDLYVHSSGG